MLNKGRIIRAGRVNVEGHEVINIPLLLTSEMLPSFRFVAYYVLPWQFKVELVADSISVDVESHCVEPVSQFVFNFGCLLVYGCPIDMIIVVAQRGAVERSGDGLVFARRQL